MSNCCDNTTTNFADSVTLDSLLRHVIPELPDVPHDMALDRVRQAYIEFARRSLILTYKDVQDYQTDVSDYFLNPPSGYEVYQVLGIESPGYSYVDYWQGNNYGLWKNGRFDVIDNKRINFQFAPSIDSENGLTIYEQIIPTHCCTTIPVSIENAYGWGISRKAVSTLLKIPNKPWTAIGLAREAELEYNRAVMAAKNLAMTNRKYGTPSLKYRRVI